MPSPEVKVRPAAEAAMGPSRRTSTPGTGRPASSRIWPWSAPRVESFCCGIRWLGGVERWTSIWGGAGPGDGA